MFAGVCWGDPRQPDIYHVSTKPSLRRTDQEMEDQDFLSCVFPQLSTTLDFVQIVWKITMQIHNLNKTLSFKRTELGEGIRAGSPGRGCGLPQLHSLTSPNDNHLSHKQNPNLSKNSLVLSRGRREGREDRP